MTRKYVFVFMLLLLMVWRCSSVSSPRKAVLDFLEAVHDSDTSLILDYADLGKMAGEKLSSVASEQREKLILIMKNNILHDLVDNGATRMWWEGCLKVVAGEKINKDQAEVEVTLIDRKTGIKHYTKMRLFLKDGRWRVYYFED